MKVRRISERRIHMLLGISRTGQRYEARPKPQDHLADQVKALSIEHPRYGQNRVWALLRRSGVVVNIKAINRLWQKLGFAVVGTLPGAYRHQRLGLVDALVMYKTLSA